MYPWIISGCLHNIYILNTYIIKHKFIEFNITLKVLDSLYY